MVSLIEDNYNVFDELVDGVDGNNNSRNNMTAVNNVIVSQ